MKRKMKRWMLAAMLVATGGATASAEELSQGAIGDLPGYGEDTYFAEEAAYSNQAPPAPDAPQGQVGAPQGQAEFDEEPTQQVAHQEVQPASPVYAPIAASQLERTAFLHGSPSASCGSCDTMTCDGGCGKTCGGNSLTGGLCDPTSGNTWTTFEALLWFVEGRDTVPLITTNALDAFPEIGVAGTEVAFGSPIESGLAPGFRIDGGIYLGDNIGIGGRFWQIYDGEESATIDDPSVSIGRSFFNTALGAEGNDAFLVQIEDGVGGVVLDRTGSVRVESEIEMWAAEAYARVRFSGGKHHSLDLIGGYTHFEYDESLNIFSSSDFLTEGSIATPLGSNQTFEDHFDIDNSFDGGQIGFETVLTRGKWMVRSLTKVHLGNMTQTFSGMGTGTLTTPLGGPTTTPAGVLNRVSENPFEIEQSEFAFIPEANFKLAYQFRPSLLMSVGYSFLYLDNVATSASAITGISEFDTAAPAGPFPAAPTAFATDSLFVHGVDLGLIFNF